MDGEERQSATVLNEEGRADRVPQLLLTVCDHHTRSFVFPSIRELVETIPGWTFNPTCRWPAAIWDLTPRAIQVQDAATEKLSLVPPSPGPPLLPP
ncbi:unnamed protein product [Lampetra fluviatilis]